MASGLIEQYLQPGDRVLVGQAVAEPPELTRQLVAAAETVPGVVAYCGYTMGSAWDAVQPGGLTVRGFIAHGGLRRLAKQGMLDVLPWHLSAFETLLRSQVLAVDIVVLHVGPRDARGYYNLGGTIDYALAAVPHARTVLVEVNDNMPRTQPIRASHRLHRSQVHGEIRTSTDLVGSPARPANEAERQVARHVVSLVPDGACLQLGLGPLADEIVARLGDHRHLQVRAGVAGDWLVRLYEAGVMVDGPASALVSMALGTQRLYSFLDSNPRVQFGTTADLVDPSSVAAGGPLFAVNSALEVDLTGQVNSEVVADRYVGGIGGQVDFLRAARIRPGGLAIVALASTHPNGESRIVTTLTGPVTTPRSDVDVVITEHGIADLRAASISERVDRLIAVAAPQHRRALAAR